MTADKPWDKPWSMDHIIDHADKWSLSGDVALLNTLKCFAENLLTRTMEIDHKLNDQLNNLNEVDLQLNIAKNSFQSLRNSQFIESRVYEDDETLPQIESNGNVEDKDEVDTTEYIKIAVQKGLDVLEGYFDRVRLSVSDSEDEDIDFPTQVYILRPKDLYLNRPLPYVIGSEEWHKSWHVGLADSSSDSETGKVSDKYSESESDSDLPILNAQTKGASNTSSELDFSEKPENSQLNATSELLFSSSDSDEQSSKLPDSEKHFAQQLAAKLVNIEQEINRRPLQKPKSQFAGDLFFDEPPPLVENKGPFSGGPGLFDDDDDDNGLFSGKSEPTQTGSLGIFDEENSEDDTFRGKKGTFKNTKPPLFAEEPPELRGKKKPIGGVSVFGGVDVFGKTTLSDTTVKGDEKHTEESKIRKKVDLFDDDDEDLFTSASKQEKPVGRTAGKGGVFDNGKEKEKAPVNSGKMVDTEKTQEKPYVDLFDSGDELFKGDLFSSVATKKFTSRLFDDEPLSTDSKTHYLFEDDGPLSGDSKRHNLFEDEPLSTDIKTHDTFEDDEPLSTDSKKRDLFENAQPLPTVSKRHNLFDDLLANAPDEPKPDNSFLQKSRVLKENTEDVKPLFAKNPQFNQVSSNSADDELLFTDSQGHDLFEDSLANTPDEIKRGNSFLQKFTNFSESADEVVKPLFNEKPQTKQVGPTDNPRNKARLGLFDSPPPEQGLFVTDHEDVIKKQAFECVFENDPDAFFGEIQHKVTPQEILGPKNEADTKEALFVASSHNDDLFGENKTEEIGDDLFVEVTPKIPSNVALFDSTPPPDDDWNAKSDASEEDLFADHEDIETDKTALFSEEPPPLNVKVSDITQSFQKESSSKQIKSTQSSPGKLKHNLTINVQALIPGSALPKFRSDDNTTAPEDDIKVLPSVTKDRPRIPFHRRPSTRKGRKEALEKSSGDFMIEREDEKVPEVKITPELSKTVDPLVESATSTGSLFDDEDYDLFSTKKIRSQPVVKKSLFDDDDDSDQDDIFKQITKPQNTTVLEKRIPKAQPKRLNNTTPEEDPLSALSK